MARLITRRLLSMLPMLLGITLITFILSNLIPGDPARLALGVHADAQAVANLRQEMGLDRGLPEQYVRYMGRLLTGNWGRSIVTRRPVLAEIGDRFPATLELTIVALAGAAVLGVVLGAWSAVRREQLPDHLVRVVSVFGVSSPVFWVALLLMHLFYIKFPIIHGMGRIDPALIQGGLVPTRTGLLLIDTLLAGRWQAFGSALNHLILPATVLSLSTLTRMIRMTRSSLLEVLQEEFIRVAAAKGLPQRLVIYRHALRNALIPVVTMLGAAFSYLLAGATLVETVFAWPGMGRLAYEAVVNLDYPVVVGVTLVASISLMVVNLLVDLTYMLLDPRLES